MAPIRASALAPAPAMLRPAKRAATRQRAPSSDSGDAKLRRTAHCRRQWPAAPDAEVPYGCASPISPLGLDLYRTRRAWCFVPSAESADPPARAHLATCALNTRATRTSCSPEACTWFGASSTYVARSTWYRVQSTERRYRVRRALCFEPSAKRRARSRSACGVDRWCPKNPLGGPAVSQGPGTAPQVGLALDIDVA